MSIVRILHYEKNINFAGNLEWNEGKPLKHSDTESQFIILINKHNGIYLAEFHRIYSWITEKTNMKTKKGNPMYNHLIKYCTDIIGEPFSLQKWRSDNELGLEVDRLWGANLFKIKIKKSINRFFLFKYNIYTSIGRIISRN